MREGMAVVAPGAPGAEILLNGSPLGADPTPVMHGDKLRIGGQEITVADPRRAGQTAVVELSDLPGFEPGSGVPDPGPNAEAMAGQPPRIEPVLDPSAGPAPRLVSLMDGREYRIEVVPFVIGRDAVAEVVVESGEVSRRHAEIVTRPDGDVVVDLSSNGTFVNGRKIDARQVLKTGDVIKVGGEEFRYYAAEKPLPAPGANFRLADTMHGFQAYKRASPPSPFLAASEPPLARVLVKRGELEGQRLEVRTPVVNIGRADYNDLKLPDASVSASHAKLQLKEGVWVLIDLGSTNGVMVDGERVKGEAPLSPGATIEMGEVRLVFEPKDEGAPKEPRTKVLSPEMLASARENLAGQPPLPQRGELLRRGSPSRKPTTPAPTDRTKTAAYVMFALAVLIIAILVFILV